MEVSWFHFLKHLSVSQFETPDGGRYALLDERSSKIYLTNEDCAKTIRTLKAQGINALESMDEDILKQTIGIVEQIRTGVLKEKATERPFNPLFFRYDKINLTPYNPALKAWATRINLVIWPLTALLVCAVIFLGITTEWAILEAGRAVLSVEGLAIFAVMSPFLKIPHELGHALVARAFNVPIHKAGLIFIGLFPLPFIDCSLADTMANRSQRIRISLAGIFVDVFLALVSFILWHFTTGEVLKTLFSTIFVFQALNSTMFNGNPLIRMDGYFAFSDWIGHRNLSTNAQMLIKGLWQKISTFGAGGRFPARDDLGYFTYGLGATVYKIYILATIIWLVLPRFFGFGLVFAVWGAYAMFFSPLFAQSNMTQNEEETRQTRRRKSLFWLTTSVLITGAMYLPFPLRAVVNLDLDTGQSYLIQPEEPGFIHSVSATGPLTEGAQIYQLSNTNLENELEIERGQLEVAKLSRGKFEQIDPQETQIAQTQITGVEETIQALEARISKLSATATKDLYFVKAPALRSGDFVGRASPIGYAYPNSAGAILQGSLNQRFLQKLENTRPNMEIWTSGEISKGLGLVILQETRNPETRSVRILVTADGTAANYHSRDNILKIHFGTQPLYAHINDGIQTLLLNYRSTRLSQG